MLPPPMYPARPSSLPRAGEGTGVGQRVTSLAAGGVSCGDSERRFLCRCEGDPGGGLADLDLDLDLEGFLGGDQAFCL